MCKHKVPPTPQTSNIPHLSNIGEIEVGGIASKMHLVIFPTSTAYNDTRANPFSARFIFVISSGAKYSPHNKNCSFRMSRKLLLIAKLNFARKSRSKDPLRTILNFVTKSRAWITGGAFRKVKSLKFGFPIAPIGISAVRPKTLRPCVNPPYCPAFEF